MDRNTGPSMTMSVSLVRMPHSRAMARAVVMLSPVTMRTLMPARWQVATAWRGGQTRVSDAQEIPEGVPRRRAGTVRESTHLLDVSAEGVLDAQHTVERKTLRCAEG